MTWASFILTLVGPIAVKLLAFFGIALTTITGVDLAFQTLQTYATSNWSGLPASVLQLASLAGVPTALGIIFGAFNARLVLWSLMSAKRFLFK